MQNFDWKFYINYYPDLKNAKINTKEKAINHYNKFGKYEKRRTHQIIFPTNNITYINSNYILSNILQVYISEGLYMCKERILQKYDLKQYFDSNLPSLFFGVYTNDDLYKLKNHTGIKYIIWGGEDANPNLKHSLSTLNEVKLLHNTVHISISKCIYQRLVSQNIVSILVDFNLVDTDLFKPVQTKGSKVFIFNGQRPGREQVYGKEIYMEVMACLPEYSYILSNTLNEPYENMPKIYSECFIMLRLTKYDGNANSVQECEAMNIPVVHNQSKYGLKWNSTEDVINLITKYKP
jgi:hypothetical protein